VPLGWQCAWWARVPTLQFLHKPSVANPLIVVACRVVEHNTSDTNIVARAAIIVIIISTIFIIIIALVGALAAGGAFVAVIVR
jgi:multisubunit Na+/H+ antiporter MnhB subunit